MNITRKEIAPLLDTIGLLEQNENFSITTKYKVLKIKDTLKKEMEYNSTLIKALVDKYGTIDDDGSILIKKEHLSQANQELIEFNNDTIELPPLYFSLEELQDNISWAALETFMPFIK